MSNEVGIKSIQIVSDDSCYKMKINRIEEEEQRLTISATGQVRFSARNYQQCLDRKGFCRKKQMSIGPWKAAFLLWLISRIDEPMLCTDVGSYELTICFENGEKRLVYGSMIGDVTAPSYGNTQVSLTEILQRYVPIEGLWGFGGFSSSDDGYESIIRFDERWEAYFRAAEPSLNEFIENFGNECAALGFQMDCGNEFSRLYPGCFNAESQAIFEVIDSIQDIELLGSAVFSRWRYLTHWAYEFSLNRDTCEWFIAVLGKMREVSEKKL